MGIFFKADKDKHKHPHVQAEVEGKKFTFFLSSSSTDKTGKLQGEPVKEEDLEKSTLKSNPSYAYITPTPKYQSGYGEKGETSDSLDKRMFARLRKKKKNR